MSEAELTASIKAAGDEIRALKGANADKETIMAKVRLNKLSKITSRVALLRYATYHAHSTTAKRAG